MNETERHIEYWKILHSLRTQCRLAMNNLEAAVSFLNSDEWEKVAECLTKAEYLAHCTIAEIDDHRAELEAKGKE